MKSRIRFYSIIMGVMIALFAQIAESAPRDEIVKRKETCRDIILQQDGNQIAQWLINLSQQEDSQPMFEAFGEVLALSSDYAPAILNALDEHVAAQADSIRAELIFWLSRGDETPKYQWRERNFEPVLLEHDQVGELAEPLLRHEDPFVRAFAELTIATLVWNLNDTHTTQWPEDAGPTWYQEWQKVLTPDYMLECDYARQAGLRGDHRNKKTLMQSAKKVINQVEKMVSVKQLDQYKTLQILHSICESMASIPEENLVQIRKHWINLRQQARDIVLANPDIDFSNILMATRNAFHDGPNITAGAKSYIIKPGGDIYIKKGLNPSDPTQALIEDKLKPGHMRGMELWWDADKLVFAYAEQPDYYNEFFYESDQGFADKKHGVSEPVHLYEINIDGGNLTQVTDHEFNSDVEPTYLPNGDIVFCSDRSNFGSQCSGHFFQNKKIVNLYRVSPKDKKIRALSNNKDFDRYPHVLDDGQIIYTRWEYQERHLWQTHNLWTSHPDGTMSDAIYKQHINTGPMALRDTRQIPNSHKLVSIACGHHEYAQGAVTIIDHHQGINNSEGMRLVTPNISPREGGLGKGKPVDGGGIEDNGGLYQQPFALSENSFLVSYSYDFPNRSANAGNFALYYIDVWGNKELIHREPLLSVVYPIPLKERKQPPIITEKAQPDQSAASIYAIDVHSGVPEIEPGTIKYIRIGHRTEWPTVHSGNRVVDFNHLHYTPSGSWARTLGVWTWTPARVIGTIPVEDDGSAFFKVPSNIPLYFQALDENYMEVRRMRSFVIFQPGEMRGCTGCHETKDEAPLANYTMPSAVKRDPSMPVPPSWGSQELPDFEKHIQPILNQNCVSCHGQDYPAAGLEFTDRKIDGYCQSYRTMFGLKASDQTPVGETWSFKLFFPEADTAVKDVDTLKLMETNQYPNQLISLSNRFGDASISKPYEFGSHKSKLITALLDEHHQENVNIAKQDWIDLVTWVDLNAPYWGSFVDKEPIRHDQQPKRIRVTFPEPFVTHYPTELVFSEEPTTVIENNIQE